MTIANICNCAAWCGCGIVGAILLMDFIRTERQMSKRSEKEESVHE